MDKFVCVCLKGKSCIETSRVEPWRSEYKHRDVRATGAAATAASAFERTIYVSVCRMYAHFIIIIISVSFERLSSFCLAYAIAFGRILPFDVPISRLYMQQAANT